MARNLIDILPDNVANQIAAGEVVQRPASMVKELMENAVDAGAQSVTVQVKDGGKTLVQVIDDGSGMGESDAVMCFARHATSKIRRSKDLFSLHTFGFRGEALASIASVAEVELRTRRRDAADDELGTCVTIAGGTEADASVTTIHCPHGTNIAVRNLFFNTPARRKFLKANTTETRQIIAEFQRVALCHPELSFVLVADDKMLFNLMKGSLRQRIAALVGRRTGDRLLDVSVDSPIVRISGYVGVPATAKKSNGEQFFFVNGRYFRSPYLQKAVLEGYSKMLPAGQTPSFFIYIEVEPHRIDVNIHPQKTEVKFEDEQAIWQMLHSAVSRSLGKHNIIPVLDFDNQTPIEIPVYQERSAEEMPPPPPESLNPEYNPFQSYDRQEWTAPAASYGSASRPRQTRAWGSDPEQAPFTEAIPPSLLRDSASEESNDNTSEDYQELISPSEGYTDMGEQGRDYDRDTMPEYPRELEELPRQTSLDMPAAASVAKTIQLGSRYLATVTADGLVVIDRYRACLRIAYEELLRKLEHEFSAGQRDLFPETVELSPADHFLLVEHAAELAAMGFDLRDMGGSTVVVYGLPVEMTGTLTPREAVESLLLEIKAEGNSLRDNHRERLASALARSCVAPSRRTARSLTPVECETLVRKLFACNEPAYTPDGLPVITVLSPDEIGKRLKK